MTLDDTEDQTPQQSEEDFFKSITPPRPGAPLILPQGSPPPANPEEEKFFQENFQQYSDEQNKRAGYQNPAWIESLQKNLPWTQPFIEGIQGIGSGPVKTVRGGSQILHKVFPAIPEIPQEYATPPTTTGWGEIMQPVEQGAEFLIPAGKVGQVQKVIGGAKNLPRVVKWVGKAAAEAPPAAGISYVQSGGDVEAARASALGTAATAAALPIIGKILAETTGMSTGVGGYAVERAATNPTPELVSAMKGDITEAQVLRATRDAADYVKTKRSADYLHLRNQLPSVQLNLRPVQAETLKALKDFDIVPTLNPQTGSLVLDFSHSPINIKAAQDQIQSVVDDLAGWRRTDTLGMDNLKRRMDNLYFENSDAHAFVNRIKNSVRDQLNTVPGYKNMTRGYSEMSDFVDNLTELSLDAKNDGTAIRKLAGSLKQNNEYRRLLLEALDGYTNKDLVGMVAGTRLRPMMPRGIVGALHAATWGTGVSSGAAILHDPKVLLSLFGMSPRAVGEMARRARLASRFGKAAAAQQSPGMIQVTGQQPESYDVPRMADGGEVDDDDNVLRKLQRRQNDTFRINVGAARTQPLELRDGSIPKPPVAPPRFEDPADRFLRQSAEQVKGGWNKIWGPSGTTAADPAWWERQAQGASDVIRGSTPFLAPIAIPAAMAAPAPAIAGLVTGMAGTTGGEYLAKKAGVPPGQAALFGDVAGLGSASLGSETASAMGALRSKTPAEASTLSYEQTPRSAVAGRPGGELQASSQRPSGAPVTSKRPEGNPALQKIVNDYNAQRGLPPVDHSQYHPLDEDFGRRVADAYDALLPDKSRDPRVRAAYEALVRETKDQYNHLIQNGYTLEPWTKPGQPYKNSQEMVADLKNNKHLYFFTGGEPHPFLSAIDPDTGLAINDMFRGVHDAWAHATGGFGFGARGEEMAHDMHSQSYSPLARQAMTTETRGQNSWVNFGRHNYDAEDNPLHIPATEKPFAMQKVDILPPEFWQRAGERYAAPSARPEVTTRGPQQREPDVSGGRSAVVLEPARMDPATRAEYSRFQNLLKTEGDNLGFDRTKQAVEAILMHKDWATRWDVRDPELIRLGNKFGGWEGPALTGTTPKALPPGYQYGGPVRYDDGGEVDNDDYLRKLQQRRLSTFRINLGLQDQPPLELSQGPRPSNAPQMLAPSREVPDQPINPAQEWSISQGTSPAGLGNIPRPATFSDAMSKVDVRPELVKKTSAIINQPFTTTPVIGGSPMELSDIIPKPPESGLEWALLGATVIPPGKLLKAGTTMLEGAVPEVGLLGKAIRATETTSPLMRSVEATPTGARLGSGTWARGETDVAARDRQIRDLIEEDRRINLSPQEQETFDVVRRAHPEISNISDYLMSQEVKKLISSPKEIEAMNRLLRVLPNAEKMAALATAGAPKLGWYRGSSQALMDVFGDDAPRFAQLLAATSPRTSVESNLINSLNIWKNWIKEGRPADRESIMRIMGRSVQGGTEKSALDAWKNNTFAALSSADPMSLTLSGPKVDSFQHNLRDNVLRVTNDAWMANAFNVAGELFQGKSPKVLAGNPGMTTAYGGTSARIRHGAALAGMYPSQGQETIWSAAMQLYERAREYKMDPRDLLQKGLLTPQMLSGTPDFSTLLRHPEYARVLEEAGYGDVLQKMKPFVFEAQQSGLSNLTPHQQQLLMESAGTISDVMSLRDRESRSLQFAPGKGWTGKIPKATTKSEEALETRQRMLDELYPQTASGVTNIEEVPGVKTRHLPEVAGLPRSGRDYFTSKMNLPKQNLAGQDIIQTSSGLATIPTRSVQGAYLNSLKQAEGQPGRALGYEAQLGWNPRVGTPEQPVPYVGTYQPTIDPQTMANLQGGMAAHALYGAQEGVGSNILVPNPPPPTRKGIFPRVEGKTKALRIPLEKEATEEQMLEAVGKYGKKYAFASSGPDVHVLGLGKTIPKTHANDILKIFGGQDYIPAENIGDYVDLVKEWSKKPGTGAATKKFFQYADQMSPNEYARLDQELRQIAGDTLETTQYYQGKKKMQTRDDFMNLLDITAKQGLSGVQTALKNGVALPGLIGAFLLPSFVKLSSEESASAPATAPTPSAAYASVQPAR
jgi:hypothetical protein